MKKYLSLVLFAHSVFALPFALIGFFLALHTTEYAFSWKLLLLMLLCMVTARNAAMAFNRYLDRDIDAINPRTAMRDIPAGKISAKNALIFTIVNCLLFVAATYFINSLCFMLSPIALFVVLFLFLYQTYHAFMPFGIRCRIGFSADRSISRYHGAICNCTCPIWLCCADLGEWF